MAKGYYTSRKNAAVFDPQRATQRKLKKEDFCWSFFNKPWIANRLVRAYIFAMTIERGIRKKSDRTNTKLTQSTSSGT